MIEKLGYARQGVYLDNVGCYSGAMNEDDRKILEYLASKDKVVLAAIARDTSLSGEIIMSHLSVDSFLLGKDYARIEWPVGNAKFAYITEKGRKALWGCKKHTLNFLSENWLNIIGTIAAIIAAVTGIISIVK